jgi:hypothetical protein
VPFDMWRQVFAVVSATAITSTAIGRLAAPIHTTSGIGSLYVIFEDCHNCAKEQSSVPIPKFLFNFCVDCESSAAEALDRSQDVVGGFGPLERSGGPHCERR